MQEFIPLPETEEFKDVQISTDQDSSIVPITLGSRRKPYDEVNMGHYQYLFAQQIEMIC